MVQFVPLPSIRGPLCSRVPIKCLRDIICEIAHVAAPSMSMIHEGHIGVYVCPTTPAAGDNLILDDGNGIVIIMQGTIGLNDECEWQF
jgi:hypothetical protein